MKRIYITALSLLFSIMMMAQTLPSNITDSFRKGNAALLNGNLANRVTLVLPGSNTETDSSAAERELEKFFRGYRPSDFSLLHKTQKGDSGFTVGKLTTAKGEYRVHLLFRQENNKYLIHQIRIDKFNE